MYWLSERNVKGRSEKLLVVMIGWVSVVQKVRVGGGLGILLRAYGT